MNVVMFTGPRSGAGPYADHLVSIVQQILRAGHSISVGCALGVDQLVITTALQANCADQLTIFCSYGASGAGFIPGCSAPYQLITSAVHHGANVKFWAGGGPSVVGVPKPVPPPVARLVNRSLACVKSANQIVAFPKPSRPNPFADAHPGQWPACGSGTWASLGAAILLDIPIWVFTQQPDNLPDMPGNPGQWTKPVQSGLWSAAYQWTCQPNNPD